MKNSKKALVNFKKGFNCAQSVFCVYCKKYGIDEKQAKLISAAFGGGIGRTQDICGALTGAIMVIGCRYFDEKNIDGSKDIIYQKTRKLISNFKKIHKHKDCLDLIGFNLLKKNEFAKFKKLNIHESKCSNYVSDVCKLLDEIL
jgi:C_GCAxxG_C_C family probable redox protein